MELGKSTVKSSLTREINELRGIIGELTIANEGLKNSPCKKRREAMNDLVSNGIPKSRSMIDYQRRKREPQYDVDLEKRISHIVEERPSYGTRRVTQ